MNGKLRLLAVVAVVMMAVAAGVGVALAAPLAQGEPPLVPGMTEVLGMLASGIGVGATIAFLFEKFQWFQDLPANGKWWLTFGLSLGLPLAAQLLLQFVPTDVWAAIEPYWRALATGFLVWTGSQVIHRLNAGHPLS